MEDPITLPPSSREYLENRSRKLAAAILVSGSGLGRISARGFISCLEVSKSMESTAYEELCALEDRYWWHIAKQELILSLIESVLKEHFSVVLEVGCGTGGLLQQLVRRNRVVLGLDISYQVLSRCANRGLRPSLVQGHAERLPFKDGTFDLVIASEVLEHAADDADIVQECNRVLKTAGVLIITVPALPYLWSAHDVIYGHRRRYGRQQIERLLDDFGYTILKISYSNSLILPAAIAVKLLKRCIPSMARRSDFYRVPVWFNKLLIKLYRIETKIICKGRLPIGVSLVAIASKGQGGER